MVPFSPGEVMDPVPAVARLDDHGAKLKKVGAAVQQTGAKIQSTWQGLNPPVYTAAESALLLSATDIVRDRGVDIETGLSTAAGALETFSGEMDRVNGRLKHLKMDVQALYDWATQTPFTGLRPDGTPTKLWQEALYGYLPGYTGAQTDQDLRDQHTAIQNEIRGYAETARSAIAGAVPGFAHMAGVDGWAAMFGADVKVEATGENGKDLAKALQDALAAKDPERVRAALDALRELMDPIENKVRGGGTIAEDDAAFLHGLYGGLDKGLVDVPEQLRGILGGKDAAIPPGLAALGTGLLILSNKNYRDPSWATGAKADPWGTKGTYRVPDGIRSLLTGRATGPTPFSGDPWSMVGKGSTTITKWREFTGLNDLLNAAVGDDTPNSRLTGGRDFSKYLTARVAEMAKVVDDTERQWAPHPVYGKRTPGDDEVLQNLLGIATRNRDANYDVLTGKLPEDAFFKGSGVDQAKQIVRPLYSLKWTDHGAAAAGLTDWIAPEAARGNPQAREATASLLSIVTDKSGGKDSMWNLLIDGYGNGKSIGQVNGDIARSLGRVAAGNIDQLADRNAGQVGDLLDQWFGTRSEKDNEQRVRDFFQVVAGDRTAARGLAGAVRSYQNDLLSHLLNGGLDRGQAEELSEKGGRLQALLDGALYDEAFDRTGEKTDARKQVQDLFKVVAGGGTVISPFTPTPIDDAAANALSAFLGMTSSPDVPQQPPNIDSWWDTGDVGDRAFLIRRDLLEAAVRTGRVTLDEANGLHDLLELHSGRPGERHLGTADDLFQLKQQGLLKGSEIDDLSRRIDQLLRDRLVHGDPDRDAAYQRYLDWYNWLYDQHRPPR